MPRRLGKLCLLLTIAVAFACTSTATDQKGPTDSQIVPVDCRIVQHGLGKACVPINPQRVVVLSDGLDAVLSLGVKPAGSTQSPVEDDYLKNGLEGIEIVGTPGHPNLEAIVALKPDLILGIKSDNQYSYKLLSQIAPTILAEAKTNGDWQTILKQYAQAVGKADKAEQIITDYHARIEQFQARMSDRLSEIEVSIVNVRHDRIFVYLDNTFSGKIVANAGLSRPSHQTTAGNLSSLTISKELFYKADGDVIFLWTSGSAILRTELGD